MDKRPVIFGEILFDCFPDGSRVLAGAPFNVCRNLKYLGYHPLMISRLGEDEMGAEVQAAMRERGMDETGVQSGPEPTGMVTVELIDDEPHYEIAPGQAWDFIDPSEALSACLNIEALFFYTGTLALRGERSKSACRALLDDVDAPLFFDANLRQHWWDLAETEALLRRATWVKCNPQEYRLLFGEADPRAVREQYDLELLILTRGGDGAALVLRDTLVEGRPPVLEGPLLDTVGAGDAFSSVVIDGIFAGKTPETMLREALLKGSELCRIRGADWI